MELAIQAIVVGVSLGFLYSLVGLTYTLVYNSSKVLVFALGEMVMVSALLTGYCLTNWKFPALPSILAIIVGMIIFSVLIFKLIIAPLLKTGGIFSAIISTLILSVAMTNVAGLLTRNYPVYVKPFFDISAIQIGPAALQSQYIVLILGGSLFMVAFWYFSFKTRWGVAFRACGFDPEAGRMLGIKTNSKMMMAFVIAGFITAFGGIIYAPVATPTAMMGAHLSFAGFVASVIGGLAHPFGAIVGGLLIGITQSLLTAYTNSMIAEISTFAILLVILVIRPQGIFKEKE
jgi:branched-chain amino acid transport system permease protein